MIISLKLYRTTDDVSSSHSLGISLVKLACKDFYILFDLSLTRALDSFGSNWPSLNVVALRICTCLSLDQS